jgi:hypothetical protein
MYSWSLLKSSDLSKNREAPGIREFNPKRFAIL